ncbi:MAG TPA: SRPBCC family protein [Candidatus Limnocylindrales bacterium]
MPAAQHAVTIRRSPEDVFAFVADGTTAPRWRPGVLDIVLIAGSGVGARYRQGVRGPGGRRIDADYEVTAYEPPTHLGFVATAGPVRPRGEYRFAATEDGTRVIFALEAELGGIKRLLMGSAVQRTMESEVRSLERLKAVLEG